MQIQDRTSQDLPSLPRCCGNWQGDCSKVKYPNLWPATREAVFDTDQANVPTCLFTFGSNHRALVCWGQATLQFEIRGGFLHGRHLLELNFLFSVGPRYWQMRLHFVAASPHAETRGSEHLLQSIGQRPPSKPSTQDSVKGAAGMLGSASAARSANREAGGKA